MIWISLALATPYDNVLQDLSADRARIARLPRSTGRERARARLLWAFREDLANAWLGTPWAFHGTSQVPNTGTIACGYFISTLLEDAGLRVERVRMAQQASEYIVKTFAPPTEVRRFRSGDHAAVIADTLARPDGLYIVGMDVHVGMLVKRSNTLEFCHSSYVGPAVVVCSDPNNDPGFLSQYHVVGPVLTDDILDAWLDGTAVVTVTD